ncbi:MAG: sugar phosphate isomerase/epimerase [Bacteroidetes bacterium]|nr:sugar phosphate isomerase/epimerase [Bacteroidota bacterium]
MIEKIKINRRSFTRNISMAGLAATLPVPAMIANSAVSVSGAGHLKISLNAFSFNDLLLAKKITIDDVLDFCARIGIEGVDLTGYYFPGYPEAPSDEYIFHVKKKAFRLGIDLGCTGVRNDFTWADPDKRKAEKKLVKDWIVVAQKLGAPGLRIFAGTLSKEEYSWEKRAGWIVEDIRECAEFAKSHGVMLALQNHFDFAKTADEVEKLLKMIDHEWVGLMLDVGSYHSPDPYRDIAATAKYAITWQMKEKVFVNDTQVESDYNKIIDIVKNCGYRGYLPLETLGSGDPYQKVEALYSKVKKILG